MLQYFYYIFLVVCANAIEVDEVKLLFHKKDCIPGSSISLKANKAEGFMIETSSEKIHTNISATTAEAKSVTARLNELVQLNQITYSYELLSEEGPPHNKKFLILLKLGNEMYKGAGSSYKSAMRDAALLALESTSYDVPMIKLNSEKEGVLSPKSLLNNIALKLGFSVKYYLLNGKEEKELNGYGPSDHSSYGKSKSFLPKLNSSSSIRIPIEEPQISGPFSVKLKALNLEFVGTGHTIKSAEHDAASKALKYLEKNALLKKNVCNDEDKWEDCKKQKESLKTPITRLNEAAQKLGTSFDCTITSESGKPHKKVFTTQCTLADHIAEGVGNSKKESKRLAAEKMLENFSFEAQQFDKNAIVKSFGGLKKNKRKKKMIVKHKQKNWGLGEMSDVLASVWGSAGEGGNVPISDNDNKQIKSRSGGGSLKNKLLELGNQLGIQIEFSDIYGSAGGASTLVSLGVEPSQICLGEDITEEKAHEKAALHGLKFLYKSGIVDKIEMNQDKEDSIIAKLLMQEDDNVIYAVIENNVEKQK